MDQFTIVISRNKAKQAWKGVLGPLSPVPDPSPPA